MGAELLQINAAACVLARQIHDAVRSMDPHLPEWVDLTADWRHDAVEDAVNVILQKRRKRMAKVLEMRTR